jgi:cysteine desulfurase/selenocysteine lyase
MNTLKFKDSFPFFAALGRKHQTAVYLDNAATTHKPQVVIDALVDFYTNHNANVHRGLYDLGEGSTVMYEQAREKVARFINAKHTEEVIFTKGTTESINFVAATWAASNLRTGDHILITQAEHHANLLPWQQVVKQTGAQLSFIEIDPTTYMFKNPEQYLTPDVKLVAITAESNVLGPVWDPKTDQLTTFIAAAHQAGAKVLLDAAQIPVHQRIDVRHLNADFVVFSGHKMFGPTGIGVLYIKRELHDQLPPYQCGGSMVHAASFAAATWTTTPQKFEAGTPPIASAIGFGVAADYLTTQVDMAALVKHETSLCAYLLAGLRSRQDINIVGHQPWIQDHGHLVSFAVKGLHAHDLAAYLSTQGIAIRAGHLCAQPLINHLGFESLARVSFALYNTTEDVNHFVDALSKGITILKKL